MTDAFIGEIRAMAFNHAPHGWLRCDGTIYRVQSFPHLRAVIGTIYGGKDRELTFAVPDLRERVVVGLGQSPKHKFKLELGDKKGQKEISLDVNHMPVHRHVLNGKVGPDINAVNIAENNWLGVAIYIKKEGREITPLRARRYLKPQGAPDVTLHPDTVMSNLSTGYVKHENCQPVLTMNYFICYEGYMPEMPPLPPKTGG